MAKVKLDEFDVMFGNSDVIKPAEKCDKVDTWYDIGNYALNYIMSRRFRGGVAAGRVTGFEGLGSTGKSLLAVSVIKDPQLEMCVVIDTEGGGNSQELMEFAGVDLSKVRILKAHTFTSYRRSKKNGKIEEVADKDIPQKLETSEYIYVEGVIFLMKKLLNAFAYTPKLKDKKILIILDSIANLQSVRELNGGYDMGKKAQEVGAFFRTFDNTLEQTNVAFIYTNKLYTNFNNPYDPWVAVGGENVFYNSSLIMRLSGTAESHDITAAELKDDKAMKNTSLGTTYQTLKGFVRKSRFGTHRRTAQFMIDSQFGVTRYSGMFKLLKDFDIIQGGSTWFTLPALWDDKKFYKKDFLGLLKEDEEANIDKLQIILDETEEKMKKERGEYVESGAVDIDESQDFQSDVDSLENLLDTNEDDLIGEVIRDVEK